MYLYIKTKCVNGKVDDCGCLSVLVSHKDMIRFKAAPQCIIPELLRGWRGGPRPPPPEIASVSNVLYYILFFSTLSFIQSLGSLVAHGL